MTRKTTRNLKTNNAPQARGLLDKFKALGIILTTVSGLFTVVTVITREPAIALAVALIGTIIASIYLMRQGYVIDTIVAWLVVFVIGLAVIVLIPSLMDVAGMVYDANDLPISNEEVTIIDASGGPHITRTDDEGRYEFKRVPAGSFFVIRAKEAAKEEVKIGVNLNLINLLVGPPEIDIYVPATSTVAPTPTPTSTFTPTPTSTSTFTPSPTPCPSDSSRYGFESAEIFWVEQDDPEYEAVTSVARSAEMAKFGCYSLKLTVDLVGGHPNKSKGEAFVDLVPILGVRSVNLEGVPITVWVYVPEGSAGDPNNPNGVQVFVKDWTFKSQYGTRFDLPGFTDRWIQLSLTPSRQPPPNGTMDLEFDPSSIVIVGVKIEAGDGSTAGYSGPIYVDGVDWHVEP